MKNAVIFGGSGFIGMFFAKHLLEDSNFDKVFILDLIPPNEKNSSFREKQFFDLGKKVSFIKCDVRKEIDWQVNEQIDLIANFAAIHREPGHKDFEYFETNIYGAENICKWAEKNNCNSIIFSSSISPYGSENTQKDENTLPVPTSAYGSSKLVAEKIHNAWFERDSENRLLVIARPGVVFGPGEGGNVSRLIRALKKNYFIYMGNKDVRKAGIYVKELCNVMTWSRDIAKSKKKKVVLLNGTMDPGPSIEEYVQCILKILNKKSIIPRLPFRVLLFISYFIEFLTRPLKLEHPFSPVRIMKLTRSNDIKPKFLKENFYQYLFSLDEALLDWKRDCPEEW